ncbi:MAG: hypothetical protein LBI29_00280 [Rickettsiales bacterium]|jgi:TolB protein|nr:hypothetical protein [Rickettsiales bacterium]
MESKKIRVAILEPCALNISRAVGGTMNRNIKYDSTKASRSEKTAEPAAFNYKKVKDRVLEATMEEIYGQIIKNLTFTKLYSVAYRSNRCTAVMEYMSKNDVNDVSEYIFSEEFLNDFDFVLTVDIVSRDESKSKLRVFLWNISESRLAAGKYYMLILDKDNNNSYKLSNIISDFIFKGTTGDRTGIFDSRIAYISETGKSDNRKKQVVIMTLDGSKSAAVTDDRNIKLTPVFSRYNPDEIYYLEYLDDGAFIIRHNLRNGTFTKISSGHSMTSSANCNPDRRVDQLILSGTEQDANTNIFLFDFGRNRNKRLTDSIGINTSASFSPDGSKIVFVSNRDGQKKLYSKDLKTGEETLISRFEGIYDKPSWSPDGKLIAFVRMSGGSFYVGIMTPEGNNVRYLAKSFLVEGIKWSPNPRYLVYTKQTSPSGPDSIPKIYILDIITKNELRVNTPPNIGASDPDWIMNQN